MTPATAANAITDFTATVAAFRKISGGVGRALDRKGGILRIVADGPAFEMDLRNDRARIVIVSRGTFLFVNGKFSRPLSTYDSQEIPAGSAAKVVAKTPGAEAYCMEV